MAKSKFFDNMNWSRLGTAAVVSTAVALLLWLGLIMFSGNIISSFWSETASVLGIYFVIPAYFTLFIIITWTIILYKK